MIVVAADSNLKMDSPDADAVALLPGGRAGRQVGFPIPGDFS
jgi:hypothetical protein